MEEASLFWDKAIRWNYVYSVIRSINVSMQTYVAEWINEQR